MARPLRSDHHCRRILKMLTREELEGLADREARPWSMSRAELTDHVVRVWPHSSVEALVVGMLRKAALEQGG